MNRRHTPEDTGLLGSGSTPTAPASLDTSSAAELGRSTYTATSKRLLPLLAVCHFHRVVRGRRVGPGLHRHRHDLGAMTVLCLGSAPAMTRRDVGSAATSTGTPA